MATTLSGWAKVNTGRNIEGMGKTGHLQMWKETLTKGTSIADELGTVIDFLPAGVDFGVMLIPAATVSTGVDVVVRGAIASAGTYADLQDNLVVNAGDAGADYGVYDVSAQGEMPWYKLFFDGDAVSQANLDVYIIIPGG